MQISKKIGQKMITVSFFLSLVIIFLSIGNDNLANAAQRPTNWPPFERVPGYLDDTMPPFLVADQNRTVHAFVSQWVGDDPRMYAIVYRQWSPIGGWTDPIDILLLNSNQSQILGAFLDQDGMMHLIYLLRGAFQSPRIYYSKAPATNAGHARAWSTPKLVGENALVPSSAVIVGDNNDNLIIIYSGNVSGNGVYAIHSSDAGQSWSEPTSIYLTFNRELIPYSLQMYMGQAGQIHAVWNVVSSTGVDISLHYAKLEVDSQQWSNTFVLDEKIEEDAFFGPSFPSIVDDGDNIVVMYNSGNPDSGGFVDAGRPVQRVRLSSDGGDTWRDPITPFPLHQGRSGSHALVVDSDNVVHALFIQRIDQSIDGRYEAIGGIWHSELRNGRWTEPERFYQGPLSGHDLRAIISQGNLLLTTMREDPGRGQIGVWYSFNTLNAPELPTMPLAILPLTPAVTPIQTSISFEPNPTLEPKVILVNQEDASSEIISTPGNSIILAIVPASLLLFGIIAAYLLMNHRRP